MAKLDHSDIEQRRTLKNVMDHELFQQAIDSIRAEIGQEVLKTNDTAVRDRLCNEANALNRIQDKLESYVNDLLFLEKKEVA